MLWPDASDETRWDAVRKDESALRPGLEALCESLSIGAPRERFADGSLPVYAVHEERVLKLYPPLYIEECDREYTVLETLAGALPVPTPRPLACGELQGWGYLLMDHLKGRSLAESWPDARAEQERLVEAMGVTLRALHRTEPIRPSTLLRDGPDFLAQQAARCVERQRARGLTEPWLSQIEPFLAAFLAQLPPHAPCLLHTEMMREHTLVARQEGTLVLTGLFDFEPAMMGPPEYEFSSVGVFLTRGDRTLLRRLLLAYGYPPEALSQVLSRRLLGYALLHRYSNLPWYMRRLPPPPEASTLDELAEHWFGV